MSIKTIVSGWNTGADFAGIKVALQCGLNTGGYIPKGYRTELGAKPEYKKLGAIETKLTNYSDRTAKNILQADCTLIFYEKLTSPGTRLTFNLCDKLKKPYLLINIKKPPLHWSVVQWLSARNHDVVNIAGHRESVSPGIEKFVISYLSTVLYQLQGARSTTDSATDF